MLVDALPRLSEGAQQHPLRCISKLKPAELALVTTGFSEGVLRLLGAAVGELRKAFEAFDGGCPPEAPDGDEPCLGKFQIPPEVLAECVAPFARRPFF